MPRPDPAPLTRPLRLLRTRAPWTALLYLVLEAIAGAISIAMWLTILLIPVWLLTWPRLERRLLPLAGRDAPEPPGRWELRWQDVVLVLLTAVMAAARSSRASSSSSCSGCSSRRPSWSSPNGR